MCFRRKRHMETSPCLEACWLRTCDSHFGETYHQNRGWYRIMRRWYRIIRWLCHRIMRRWYRIIRWLCHRIMRRWYRIMRWLCHRIMRRWYRIMRWLCHRIMRQCYRVTRCMISGNLPEFVVSSQRLGTQNLGSVWGICHLVTAIRHSFVMFKTDSPEFVTVALHLTYERLHKQLVLRDVLEIHVGNIFHHVLDPSYTVLLRSHFRHIEEIR